MVRWLDFLGWIACVVYATIPGFWLLIHPRIEYWRSRRRSPYRLLLPLWLAMWLVLGLMTVRWRHLALYTRLWTWVPAVLLFAVGLWLYSQSGKNFSTKQLSGLPELDGHHEQQLATSGIRALVRHPFYLAHLLEMLAWSMGSGLMVCYGLTAFAIITGGLMIRMEDKELEQRFGEEYAAYRKRVPAVLPRFGRE